MEGTALRPTGAALQLISTTIPGYTAPLIIGAASRVTGAAL